MYRFRLEPIRCELRLAYHPMAKAHPVPNLRPHATLLENARAILSVRVAEVFSFAPAIGDPTRDKDLHDMRIAAKRLRYTLEMFGVCLGPDGPALIETVKELQERIGAIHDADVLEATARLHLAMLAQRRVAALIEAGATGSEAERVAAVRAGLTIKKDPLLGPALLSARTRARRARDYAVLVAWWDEHGGGTLRARLASCLKDDP